MSTFGTSIFVSCFSRVPKLSTVTLQPVAATNHRRRWYRFGAIHHQTVSNAIGPWLAPSGVSLDRDGLMQQSRCPTKRACRQDVNHPIFVISKLAANCTRSTRSLPKSLPGYFSMQALSTKNALDVCLIGRSTLFPESNASLPSG